MGRKKIDLEALFDTAAKEFGQVGYAGARMDRVAEEAGVNKALIYYHVGDKKKLFQVVLSRAIRTAVAEVNNLDNLPAGFSPRDYLENYMRGFFRFFKEKPHYPRMIIRELLSGGQNFSPEILHPLSELLVPLGREVARGAETGDLRPVSPVMLHVIMVSVLNALVFASPLMDAGGVVMTEDDFLKTFFDLLFNGLGGGNE